MTASSGTLTIPARYCGPTDSANGGVTAGLLAALVGSWGEPVTVTLRRPPPLETPMRVRLRSAAPDSAAAGEPEGARAEVELFAGEVLVAEAAPGVFASDVVEPVDLEAATAVHAEYRGLVAHPFPRCFVCGPQREVGDGLRLTPGPIGPGRTACGWVPHPTLAGPDDPSVVPPELGWAALDCPGGWTSDLERRPMVLGRMTAAVWSAPRVGHPQVVVGRLLAVEGRKTHTATSLYDEGQLVGRAEQVWIAVDPDSFG